jgi:Family of unknown function (DUF6152)
MKHKFLFLIPAMFVLLFSPVARAHHGQARYDVTEITVNGTVTEFQFLNPHAEVYFEVKDNDGRVKKWVGEASSPNMLVREGWTRNSIKPGDRISVIGHPAKDGSNNIFLEKLVLPNGQELKPHPRWQA